MIRKKKDIPRQKILKKNQKIQAPLSGPAESPGAIFDIPLARIILEGQIRSRIDQTETKRTKEALRKTNDLLRLAVRDASDAITMRGLDGRILTWNPGAEQMYGWSEAEALALNDRDRIPQGLREEALARVLQLSRAEIMEPYQTQRIAKDGAIVNVSVVSTALVNEAGQMYAIATTERAREQNIPDRSTRG